MSTTFCAEVLPPSAYVITCGCAAVTDSATRHYDYEAPAAMVRRLHQQTREAGTPFALLPGCEHPDHCSFLGPRVQPIHDNSGPDLNVAEHTAALLPRALGYSEDVDAGECSGDADSAEFLGRILTALAIAPDDPGIPWHRTTPRFVECGRVPGYLQEQLRVLHDIALWCLDNGRRVQWA